MKKYKSKIVDALVEAGKGCRIVSLHDVAVQTGTDRLNSMECREVLNRAADKLPDMKIVIDAREGEPWSLWHNACLVDRELFLTEYDPGFYITIRQTGYRIERADTYKDAVKLLHDFEDADRAEHDYEPDFYSIVYYDGEPASKWEAKEMEEE